MPPELSAFALGYGVYLAVFLAPFVQEDAAVIGAASAAAMGTGDPVLLFLVLVLGLSCSDIWKYWAGRAARTSAWARRMTEKPSVAAARERVVHRLGLTLLTVRFVPGTRIPAYLASGLFRVPFGPFAFYVVATGVLYAALAFALFQTLGMALGEQVRAWLPAVAVVLVVVVLSVVFLKRRRAA